MLITGLSVEGNIRIRESNSSTELHDYVVDIFNKGSGKILPDFGNLFFYSLPSGEISGKDTTKVTTGYYCKFYNTDGVLVATTNVSKIDKFETETEFIYTANASIDVANMPATEYIAKAEIYYKGVDAADNKANIKIIETTCLQISTFAQPDANNKKGIKVASGNKGHFEFTFTVKISKATY